MSSDLVSRKLGRVNFPVRSNPSALSGSATAHRPEAPPPRPAPPCRVLRRTSPPVPPRAQAQQPRPGPARISRCPTPPRESSRTTPHQLPLRPSLPGDGSWARRAPQLFPACGAGAGAVGLPSAVSVVVPGPAASRPLRRGGTAREGAAPAWRSAAAWGEGGGGNDCPAGTASRAASPPGRAASPPGRGAVEDGEKYDERVPGTRGSLA